MGWERRAIFKTDTGSISVEFPFRETSFIGIGGELSERSRALLPKCTRWHCKYYYARNFSESRRLAVITRVEKNMFSFRSLSYRYAKKINPPRAEPSIAIVHFRSRTYRWFVQFFGQFYFVCFAVTSAPR